MKDRDFLWCALNLMLDEEQELDQLCPACREQAMEERCMGCGIPLALTGRHVNAAFDEERFRQLKGGKGL